MLVLGVGGILLMFEQMAGGAVFQVIPLYMVGTALGGMIFVTLQSFIFSVMTDIY